MPVSPGRHGANLFQKVTGHPITVWASFRERLSPISFIKAVTFAALIFCNLYRRNYHRRFSVCDVLQFRFCTTPYLDADNRLTNQGENILHNNIPVLLSAFLPKLFPFIKVSEQTPRPLALPLFANPPRRTLTTEEDDDSINGAGSWSATPALAFIRPPCQATTPPPHSSNCWRTTLPLALGDTPIPHALFAKPRSSFPL